MTALLIGLVVVAVSAVGTWFALFGLDTARGITQLETPNQEPLAVSDMAPRFGDHGNDRTGGGDVRISPARRIRSTLVLVLLSVAAAGTIGALAAAVLVLAVMIVT